MAEILATLGRLVGAAGFLMAIGAQVLAFVRIAKSDKENGTAGAMLALIVPGYVLYYVWRSDHKMPGVFRCWLAGFLLFLIGMFVIAAAAEM